MSLFKKKSKDEEDLSIVDDYKEPFSWRNFWDEQVVGRIKKIKEFLKENGVLYFLLSPFQYKNRLLVKIILIALGIMIGIVPRTMTMINSAKERNASSELSNIKTGVSVGDIVVTPLASGQHDNTHILAFNITGDTEKGVPSTTSGFDVDLTALRGVTDAENVAYQYTILPVNQLNRLLIVYVDNRKQNDTTGIFGLNVHMKDQDPMKTPMEVVLSSNQDNTPIYKNGEIHLDALSDILTNNVGVSTSLITDSEAKLNEALEVYKVNEDRLNASGIELGMTTERMQEYVDKNSIMQDLNDKSTTADLAKLEPTLPEPTTITSTIKYKGKEYTDLKSYNVTDDSSTESSGQVDSAKQIVDVELPNLTSSVQKIQTEVSNVNNTRIMKYNALMKLESVLNQKISPDDMSAVKYVKKE